MYISSIDQYLFAVVEQVFVLSIRWSMSIAMHVVVQHFAMMCAQINPSEDLCPIYCPIVGAMYVDYDNMNVFNAFKAHCQSLLSYPI